MARTKNGDSFSFDFSSLDFDKKSEEQMQEVPRLNTEPVMFENAKQMAIKTDWSKDYFCFVAGSFIFGDYIEALLYAKRLKPSAVYITTCGRGSSSGKEAKVIGKVKMGNGTQEVYNKMPEGWKVQDAQTTPFGYVFITNGVSIFQNLRGENKGKRKTGLLKDSFLWKDKSKSVQNRIRPIMK